MKKIKQKLFNINNNHKAKEDPAILTKDLIDAVRSGNVEEISSSLSRGADQHVILPDDDPDDPGGSLLTLAARLGHAIAVSLLLEAGTHVDHRGRGSRTPLYRAAYMDTGHRGKIGAAGAFLEAQEADFACTPLHVAAQQGHPTCIQILVNAGADMYARDIWASIPLHRAAMNNKPEAIMQLIECGCDPQVKNKFGKTALHFAALGGGLDSAKVLVLNNLSYHEKDGQGFSALDIARVYSHHEVEWWFLKNPSAEVMRLPMAIPKATDSECSSSGLPGDGSLSNSSSSVSPSTQIAATVTYHSGAKNIDVISNDGAKPDNTKVTTQTNTASEDKVKNTDETTADKISVTIKKAVTTLKPKISPDTRHIMATKSLRIEEELSKSILEYIRRGASHLLINIHHSHDGHYQDKNGLTPLHWAVTLRETRTVEVLLDIHKVYPEALSYSGETPADLARQAGNNDILNIMNRFKVVKKVEDPEERYEELLTVIGSGDDAVKVSELLCQGAPLEPVGSLSTHALSLAVTSNRRKIVSLLIAAGAPLTSMAGGLTLLQQAWNSPDVTIRVQVLITRAYKNRLAWEKLQLPPREHLLHQGIDRLLDTLGGPTPWRTKWKFLGVKTLTSLMCTAAQFNCTLTVFFLQQAGAQSFLLSEGGHTSLHVVLHYKHWSLAAVMVKDMSASLYISDSSGILPRDIMPNYLREEIEEALHAKEKRKLDDMYEKLKDESEKEDVKLIIQLTDDLFSIYQNSDSSNSYEIPSYLSSIVCASLSVAAQRGLLQLMYMTVKVCGIHPDTVVDYTNDTTALHLAAAHGISGCVALLLDLKANPLQPDKYGHTALHFAAMNCHDSTYQLLAAMVHDEEPVSGAGTVPSEIKENVDKYLKLYRKTETAIKDNTNLPERADPAEATVTLLKQVGLSDIIDDCSDFSVDFSEGEAREVSTAVQKECQIIADGVALQDKTYEGTLTLVGSSSDGTRLYAPDECDISIVLSNIPDVEVRVVEQNEREVLDCGHRLRIEVKTGTPNFQGNTLIENFYSLITSYLECHTLHDKRLSVVPPGVTRTQVGVSLSFAWQGSQYPLLLVGVDLVPVLPLPWPKDVLRPALTPPDIQEVHLSNKADGTWRCSFAGAEVAVISQLLPEERRVFLSCKTLLSRLKAEVWMPRDVKSLYTWWDSRQWKIPIPAGFALKNAFLNVLERKRREGLEWHEQDLLKWMIKVFREMCNADVEVFAEQDEVQPREVLVPKKVYAYFGGDFEKPKVGDGAPDIIEILEQQLQNN
ncbi:ankyrin-2-like [Penaeus monodon]|uniref:ankyrin-2-like n=1 Tax=Penaeus monodon TaxID=6687 RepID=UPI0018A7B9DA|nr:ankyrin-2-like [Penaeus monodon]